MSESVLIRDLPKLESASLRNISPRSTKETSHVPTARIPSTLIPNSATQGAEHVPENSQRVFARVLNALPGLQNIADRCKAVAVRAVDKAQLIGQIVGLGKRLVVKRLVMTSGRLEPDRNELGDR